MITFIYGPYGSGKTTAVLQAIQKDVDAGIPAFLIVPEQETVQAEHLVLNHLPPSAQLNVEVLNFSRLYNRVCREYGGLSYQYVTPPIRHLLMWQNLRELHPLLEAFESVDENDSSLSEIMLSTLNECKAAGIQPAQLEVAAKKLEPDHPLGKRLRDLALIFSSYDRLVSQNYSDSADDLARLYDILKQESFFKGCHVYLDSFTSYTAVEHRVLERIFAQAENVTLTIPMPHPKCNDISVSGILESLQTLISNADLHGGHHQIILNGTRRTDSSTLAFLSENIWRMDVSNVKGASIPFDGSIQVEICDTPYAEAEAASLHILNLMRHGTRCRDIAVLMRNPDRYRGILEPALEKNGIPFFFSDKTDLCTMPPVKLLLSALRIKQYHWQKNDVISHVKIGLYDFTDRQVDLFEEYVSTWNIRGSQFTDRDWTMNPDGFSEQISARGTDILTSANHVRRNLVEILEKFYILLDAAETVGDMCRAVYRYFTDLKIEDRLHSLAQAEMSRGNKKEAKEILALYGIILNSLADIATALSEETLSTEEFATVIQMVFHQTEIGTIPTSMDEVMIGSAAMLRASNPKYVLILGLCEGEFPATVNEIGLFSSGDRSKLSELGLTLSNDSNIRSSDELMYVQRAFSAPSHGLFLFTSTSDAGGKSRNLSLALNRVLSLFEALTPHRFSGDDLRYLVGAPRSSVGHLRNLGNSKEAIALREALSEHLQDVKKLSVAESSTPTCRISGETAAEVTGSTIRFSSSRFEKYVECPFNYYCTYVLGLREKKQANFRVSQMGTFVHFILEQLLKFAITLDENGERPDDETLIKRTEETVAEYIEKICPTEYRHSRRLNHLYTRLKRLSLLMVRNIVEEFSQSDFEPAFFELNTNGKDGNPTPMEFVLEDGCRVSFAGIIDRVDLLKKDDEVYIRIVDYKTGTKVFSTKDVDRGINIQMLLYLFTLCRNTNAEFKKRIGLPEEKSPIPAGIMYLSANVPVIQVEQYEEEQSILKKASDSLKRSGLILNDEEILRAMNHNLSPKFLAGIKKNEKDGQLTGNALTSSETFQSLWEQIQSVVEKITADLRGGIADATPIQHKATSPCSYCKMKPICRKTDH